MLLLFITFSYILFPYILPQPCCTNVLFVFHSLTLKKTFEVPLIFNAVNFTGTLIQNDATFIIYPVFLLEL